MNKKIFSLLRNFVTLANRYELNYQMMSQINYIDMICEQNECDDGFDMHTFDFISKIMFDLMIKISNDQTVPYELLIVFCDALIEIIDHRIMNDQELDNLLLLFEKCNVSFNLDREMSKLSIN